MEALREVLQARELRGPSPAFTPVQLVYAVLLIGSSGFLGRKRLKDYLGIGEGSVRTMLSRLIGNGLAMSTRNGLSLTQKGKQLYERLKNSLSPIKQVTFEMPWKAKCSYGLVVKGYADKVSTGVEERDEAIRNGASAAMVLTYMPNGLHMPRITNLSAERPDFAQKIVEFFNPSPNDVIVITAADDEGKARYSALAVALKLFLGKA